MSDLKELSLDDLRREIRELDEQMLLLMRERVRLAREVGKYKLKHHLPIKDYQVEKDIIIRARERAKQLGLYEQLVEDVLKLQIDFSVKAQEEFHTRSQQKPVSGKKVLIIGGMGKMGLWFAQFFESFQHDVIIYDAHASRDLNETQKRFKISNDLADVAASADVIVVSTPISKTAGIIDQLVELRAKGLVFDICSLKTPVKHSIEAAVKAGINISSLHPMFGPGADILAGRNIIFCETGSASALQDAQKLFESTTANLITMSLDDHDRVMSVVLGLSHFVNLTFANAVKNSGFSADYLGKVASSTFRAQLDVSVPVVHENQDMYYEIQAENFVTEQTIQHYIESINSFFKVIQSKDRESFKRMMNESKLFFRGHVT